MPFWSSWAFSANKFGQEGRALYLKYPCNTVLPNLKGWLHISRHWRWQEMVSSSDIRLLLSVAASNLSRWVWLTKSRQDFVQKITWSEGLPFGCLGILCYGIRNFSILTLLKEKLELHVNNLVLWMEALCLFCFKNQLLMYPAFLDQILLQSHRYNLSKQSLSC